MSDTDDPKFDLSFESLLAPDPPDAPEGTAPEGAVPEDAAPEGFEPLMPPEPMEVPDLSFEPLMPPEPPATPGLTFEPDLPPDPPAPPPAPPPSFEPLTPPEPPGPPPSLEPLMPPEPSAPPVELPPTFDSPPTFDEPSASFEEPSASFEESPASFEEPPLSFDSPASFDSPDSFDSPASFAPPAEIPSPDTRTDIIVPPDPPPGSAPSGGSTESQSSGGRSVIWIPIAAIALIAASLFFYFRMLPDVPTPAAPPSVKPVTAEPEPAPPPPTTTTTMEMPSLDNSDDMVRTLLGSLSSHPRLPFWLETDDLVRRGVVSVVNIANGESPRRHLQHLDPGRGFETEYGRDLITTQISERSFARYDLIARMVTSFEPQPLASLYQHRLRPVCEQAYRELGYPEGSFDDALLRAIDRFLDVPVPDGPYALERRVTSWAFAEPELENLDAASKQLLRMGPDNARRIQKSLRAFRSALVALAREEADAAKASADPVIEEGS